MEVSICTCHVYLWVKNSRKSRVQRYFSFVLYSVLFFMCFPSHTIITVKQANTWTADVRDPKKGKHFCFEFVSSESKLKAKFTSVIKIFRAINIVAGITSQWFICFQRQTREMNSLVFIHVEVSRDAYFVITFEIRRPNILSFFKHKCHHCALAYCIYSELTNCCGSN